MGNDSVQVQTLGQKIAASSKGPAVSFSSVMRYVAMTISVAAMGAGVVIIGGWLPTTFPEQYRVIIGAVVFLYGAYRFVIVFFRGRGINRVDEE